MHAKCAVVIMLQIYPDGIRHIRADKRVNEWRTPGKKNITKCAVNLRQVVIALTGGELVYFEMDPVSCTAQSVHIVLCVVIMIMRTFLEHLLFASTTRFALND